MTFNLLRRTVLAFALVAPLVAHAQQGTVTYRVTTALDLQDVDLPPEVEHLRDQLGSSQVATLVLRFDPTSTLTSPQSEDSAPRELAEASGEPRTRVVTRARGGQADAQTFVDLSAGTVIQQQSFLGRTFRITSARPALDWKLTTEQAEFLGYRCQKATTVRDGVEVEAWFAPQIAASVGPHAYGGLPGLILVLTVDDQSYEATDIDLSPHDAAIVPPSSGQEVTREAFAEIVSERLRDLETSGMPGRMGRGSGTVRIIRRGN